MNKLLKSALLLAGGLCALPGGRAHAQDGTVQLAVHNVAYTAAALDFDVYFSQGLPGYTTAIVNGGFKTGTFRFDINLAATGGTFALDNANGTVTQYPNGTAGGNVFTAIGGAPLTSIGSCAACTPTGYAGVGGTAGTPAGSVITLLRPSFSANDLPLVSTALLHFHIPLLVTAGTPVPDPLNGSIALRNQNQPAASRWSAGATGPFIYGAPTSQPLPVSLVDFTARKASDGRRSQLDWVTATETGSDYFEVERSSTEGGEYTSIGVQVKGQGTSSTEHSYQSYDRSPLAGMNWYRLKIVDLSGKAGYSAARSVRFEGVQDESVSLYPNPLTRSNVSGAHLRILSGSEQSVSYTISDAGGRLVGGGSLSVAKGSGAYPVEGLESLSAGTYYLSAKGATINANLKFSKAE